MEIHLKFEEGEQRKFLLLIAQKSNLSTENLAKIAEISSRNYRDWLREEFCISFKAAQFLSDRFGIPLPEETVKITDIGQLISAIVGTLLIVAALLAFLYLIMGGIQWITSGGDKAGMETARNRITHAIVGLIIVGAAWAIMLLVQNFLGVTILGGSLPLPQPF